MRQILKEGIPAILAILVFMVVELISLLGIVSLEQWGKFEQISNSVMFAITVLGLLGGGLSQIDREGKLTRILSNVAVPLVTFYMNINVFQHTIRLEYFREDIWGINLCWLLCLAVQILILSGLGKTILNIVDTSLTNTKNTIHSFLEEIKKLTKRLWDAVYDTIKHTENHMLCTIIVCFILWAIYIGFGIYINGLDFIIANTDIFTQSVCLWTACFFIFLLICISPSVVQKTIEGVIEIKGRIMLGIIVVMALAILTYLLPSFVPSFSKVIAILVLIPLVAIFILCFIMKKLSHPKGISGRLQSGDDSETRAYEEGVSNNKAISIKYGDLAVVMLSFILPLVMLLLITALQPEGWDILTTQDLLDIKTWLNFIEKMIEITKILIQLFA